MKKPLIWIIGGIVVVTAIIGAVFLITNNKDSGDGSGSGSGSSAKQNMKEVKPSEILTLENAEDVLGINLQVYGELDKADIGSEILRTVYNYDDGKVYPSPTYMVQVTFFQSDKVDEKELLSNQEKARAGVSFKNNSLKDGVALITKEDSSTTVWIDGIGDYAKINRSNLHTISVNYKNYYFSIVLTGQATDIKRSKEDESAYKVEKLVEAAMIAIKNLEAIAK